MITQRHNPAYRFACQIKQIKNGLLRDMMSAAAHFPVQKVSFLHGIIYFGVSQ